MRTHAGDAGSHAVGPGEVVVAVLLLALAAGYLLLARRRGREPRGWSRWRTAAFLAGVVVLAAALLPVPSPYPAGDLRGHMDEHLRLGMYAPLGLVLGAPVTLLLRSVPARSGRRIGRVLRHPVVHVAGHPVSALVLSLGGLALLYLTPLYAATTGRPWWHAVVHLHVFAAGYLFAWSIAGPDPAPRRPSVPSRIVVLGIAVAGHAVLAQLLYAGALVHVPGSVDELRGAGDLMYFGGDVAEILLALALLATWHPRARAGSTAGAPAAEPDQTVAVSSSASATGAPTPAARPVTRNSTAPTARSAPARSQ